MTTELTNTPFIMRHKPDDKDYPGYWISMENRANKEIHEELILFMGLKEEVAQSIFNRLNSYLLAYLESLKEE